MARGRFAPTAITMSPIRIKPMLRRDLRSRKLRSELEIDECIGLIGSKQHYGND